MTVHPPRAVAAPALSTSEPPAFQEVSSQRVTVSRQGRAGAGTKLAASKQSAGSEQGNSFRDHTNPFVSIPSTPSAATATATAIATIIKSSAWWPAPISPSRLRQSIDRHRLQPSDTNCYQQQPCALRHSKMGSTQFGNFQVRGLRRSEDWAPLRWI